MTLGLIAFIAALGTCIGVAGGLLGVGTSVFTVLLLIHVAGLSMGSAVSTSLVIVAATSGVALIPYCRAGAVMWRAGAAFSVASMTGAFVGGLASGWMPTRAVVAIFSMAMVAAAIAMLWTPRPRASEDERGSNPSMLAVAAAGLPIGGMTGLVGLGGGFAVLPLLVLFTSTPLRSAVGTTLLVVALNTLAGLAGHFPHAAVAWRLAVCVGVAASAGSLLGARLGRGVDLRVLRRVCAAVMIVAAAAVLVAGKSGG
ncbi:MAG TPA: sulfite exporter TauE/SafE family protein [Polyangiaceae bacterium]